MRTMYRGTIYTRKLGIDFGNHAAYKENEFYKLLIWIWLWDRAFLIFIFKEKEGYENAN